MERPGFICGNCEDICAEISEERQPLRGTTVFHVSHHGRTYRHEITTSEQAAIVASDIPAVDVCQWPQDIKGGVELAQVADVGRDKPMLYCGKCNCRMHQHTTQEHRRPNQNVKHGDVASRDFAVSCHGQMYVLNLDERALWRMLGETDASGTTACANNLQRLDVCDKKGRQYPHRRAIASGVRGLEGTLVSPSGHPFINEAAPEISQEVFSTNNFLDGLNCSTKFRDQHGTFRPRLNHHGRLFQWEEDRAEYVQVASFPDPNEPPAPKAITAAAAAEQQARHDRERAEAFGVDLRQQKQSAGGMLVGTLLVDGQRYYWNSTFDQYTSFAPGHPFDPGVELTPAARAGLEEVVKEMVRKRNEGGPVTDALKNIARQLSLPTLEKLDMAADGTDLRLKIARADGMLAQTVTINRQAYFWNHLRGRYCLQTSGSPKSVPVMAELPSPQTPAGVLPSGRGRKIILED